MIDSPLKRIAILGSTGSIGCQALDVARRMRHHIEVEVLTANSNADLLIAQAMEFEPNAVVIGDEKLYTKVKHALGSYPIKVYAGTDALSQIVEMDTIDVVLNALLGIAGLAPGIAALKSGKMLAQANKEAVVIAGKFLNDIIRNGKGAIIPVDSEHSAVFQCLIGEIKNPVERIILTGSGGPFRGKDTDFLTRVTKKEALKHPNWKMGNKITIDSATLMNKGLEVIAARWYFNLDPTQIDVVIHPQSFVHGIVAFADGTLKSVMGYPDMRIPVQYALTFPDRLPWNGRSFSVDDLMTLTFEPPDTDTFPCLQQAYEALAMDGNAPCILNAANEVAVQAFLDEKIQFTQIPIITEKCLSNIQYFKNPYIDDIFASDAETRNYATALVNNNHSL